jgi:hypothetical protein
MDNLFRALFFLAVSLASQSCRPDDKNPETIEIQSVIRQEILDELKSKGMKINEGHRPPQLDISVIVSPFKLAAPYGEGDWEKGHIISDQVYTFYGQGNKQTITYDSRRSQSTSAETIGSGAFIIGEDNRFTIFSEEKGTSLDNIPFTSVAVISGMLDGTTIKDFQHAFVITDKTGDEEDKLVMPIGKSRIWADADGISESFKKGRIAINRTGISGTPASSR